MWLVCLSVGLPHKQHLKRMPENKNILMSNQSMYAHACIALVRIA